MSGTGRLLLYVRGTLLINNVAWLTVFTENYLQNAPGGEVPGALGLHQATASNIVNALFIASYITPVPAAVVADSWLGRYKIMIYSAMYHEPHILSAWLVW